MKNEQIQIDTDLLGAKLLKTAMLLKEPEKASYQDLLDLWRGAEIQTGMNGGAERTP